MRKRIAKVDAAASHVATLVKKDSPRPLVGKVQGAWQLYNLNIRPKTLRPTSEHYRLEFMEEASSGKVVSRKRHIKSGKPFIDWLLGDQHGDMVPFKCPIRASFQPTPVMLITGALNDTPAEIVFLANNRLKFRVPRSVVFGKKRGQTDESMLEFAGIRRSRAEEEEVRRKRRAIAAQRPRSPSDSIAASMLAARMGWQYW